MDAWGKGADAWGKGPDPWAKGKGKGGADPFAKGAGKLTPSIAPGGGGKGKEDGKGKGFAPPSAEEGAAMRGEVKSFDAAKGYGFIVADGLAADVYFKADQEVEKGSQVCFYVKYMRDGKAQAQDVVYALNGGEVIVGTMKSFNGKTGYGFIAVDDYPQDVYCRRQDLPDEYQALDSDSLVGVQFQFTVKITRDGQKPQVQENTMLAHGAPAAPPQAAKRTAAGAGFAQVGPGAEKRPRLPPMPASAGGLVPGGKAKGKGAAEAAFGGAKGKGGGKFTDGGMAEGVVKSYNATKGFGFINSEITNGAGDVYFQRVAVPAENQNESIQGARVSFQVQWTPDGKAQAQAIEVLDAL